MRVIFVNRFYAPDHSATSQMLTDLATGLAAGGMDVHIVTSRLRYDDPSARLAPNEVLDGVTVHRVKTSTFGRSSLPGRAVDYATFFLSASVRILSLVRKGDIAVAMTDPPLISIPAGYSARLRGACSVNWLHDVFPEIAAELGISLARGTVGRMLRRLRDGSLLKAKVNVVLGSKMRDRVAAIGVASEAIVTIPNWADGAAVRPVPRDANPLRAEWGLADRLVVGYSGNMGRAHEFLTLVEAAATLPDVAFLFIGGGAQKGQVEGIASERGLRNLLFKPYQPRERLAESLSVADAHVVTLRPELEGLIVPSKFYGISAAGRPTIFIGDPAGEIATEMRVSDCGRCVQQGDVKGLVAAICELRDDARLRERLGGNARQAFEARYDKPIAVRRWSELLGRVAG
jgi:glycosyltransferase involved in cell wall biosynthesis